MNLSQTTSISEAITSQKLLMEEGHSAAVKGKAGSPVMLMDINMALSGIPDHRPQHGL